MKTKTIFFAVIALTLCVVAFITFTHVRQDRVKAEQARESTERAREAAQRARDETKGQIAQLRDEREKLDSATIEAQRQTQSLTDAVDASKQFERAQIEKGKRGRHLSAALTISQQLKVAVAEHYQSTGRWAKTNKEAGLLPAESFRDEIIRSVSLQPYANAARIQVRYVDDNSTEREIFLIANANAAQTITWQCVSPDMVDISEFTSGCSYRTK